MKVHCPRCDRRIAEFARVEKVGVQMAVCRRCNIQAHASYEHKDGNDYWDVHFEHANRRGGGSFGFAVVVILLVLGLLALFFYYAPKTGE